MQQTVEIRTVIEPEDVAYVRANYRAIENPGSRLPAPSYYDAEGVAYVPRDYEDQETDRERFVSRAQAEITRIGAPYDAAWIAEVWEAYRGGIYGMCLKHASPETIVRKNSLIDRIEALLQTPLPGNASWLADLRRAVDALDALERPFTAFDRKYFGGSVSRDRCITAVRERYLDEAASP